MIEAQAVHVCVVWHTVPVFQNILISSGANHEYQLRGPYDVPYVYPFGRVPRIPFVLVKYGPFYLTSWLIYGSYMGWISENESWTCTFSVSVPVVYLCRFLDPYPSAELMGLSAAAARASVSTLPKSTVIHAGESWPTRQTLLPAHCY